MRKAMVKAMVKMSFVAISSFTLLAASPSTVAASTPLVGDDGSSAQQQIPAQSGSGAPIQHIPGNAATGDASKSGGSKTKGTKNGTGDTTGDGTGAGTNGATGGNTAGADRTGDTTGDGTGAATNGATGPNTAGTDRTGDTTGDGTGAATNGATGGNTAGADEDQATGTTAGANTRPTVTFSSETQGNLTVITETSAFADGSRIIRIFNNGVLVNTIPLAPGAVLDSQQAPAGQATLGSAAANPNNVAGQQSAADIAMLPATTPATPAAPIGILGASLFGAGAWLLRRGRKS